ncbi:MAG: outer membrane protein assembly factor BamA [Gammaproteobacteria bacterium]|nr:outer membrane protein assembly factor BamA [Gammaproteobacteria bacterium]MDP2140957.1 outer membrane protein assembly factor BamA [Gammaproteobacteria bacterium]MDP2349299.1 outer membrane protein assembly factor BamA [Gammaproteobacteria bacterium]
MNRTLLSTLILSSLASTAATAQNFVIEDIQIDGLQRISSGVVFGLLPVGIGDEVGAQVPADIIRAITSSEYFEEVEVSREGNVLFITVLERPSVSEINITGNRVLKTEDILTNMATADITEGGIFTRATLEAIRQGIQQVYSGRGRYGTTVDIEVEDLPRNRVAINMTVNEGEESRIQYINIVGNNAFDDEELLRLFELGVKPWYLPFSGRNKYSSEQLEGDLERLTSHYMDNGYIRFNIDSSPISITPDNEQIYITINVTEGEQYVVNEVNLAGDLVNAEAILRAYLVVANGQTFSQALVTATEEYMTQVLGNFGYAFAEVRGVPEINEEDRTVDVTFFVAPGNRTYVNRVNFVGNTATADDVLRREMRQLEAAPASSQLIELSKVRLERLGYFSTVEVETIEVPGSTDQVDVEYTVKEQNFSNISLSIGSGGGGDFFISSALEAQNFLGTGRTVGIGINKSTFQKSLNFSYLDPYFTADGVSRGFNVFLQQQDSPFNTADFSTKSYGGSFNFAYPISEIQQIGFNIGYTHTELSSGGASVQEIKSSPALNGIDTYIITPVNENPFDGPVGDAQTGLIADLPPEFVGLNPDLGFIDREGTEFDNVSFSTNWLRSTLNRGQLPTAGSFQQLSLEVTVPGSDLQYYKLNYSAQYYRPLIGDWVLALRANLGYGGGYGGTQGLPFFQNFFAGGLSSNGIVRGFDENSLGPKSTNPQYFTGDFTRLLRDENGNIIRDESGRAQIDVNAPFGYVTVPVLNDDGSPVLDANGNPQVKLAVENLQLNRDLDAFGGNILTTGSVELLFPLPFVTDRSRVRSSFFVDAGNVFSSNCTQRQTLQNNCSNFDLGEFRYSAGVSVTYLSPFGPLTFYLAKPFSKHPGDDEKNFDFTIGAGF